MQVSYFFLALRSHWIDLLLHEDCIRVFAGICSQINLLNDVAGVRVRLLLNAILAYEIRACFTKMCYYHIGMECASECHLYLQRYKCITYSIYL